jgi:[acyl-carrier-protein] S-malonyltransferase
MTKIAALFPGQGSQAVGMGKDLAERWPEAAEVFSAADASRLCAGTVLRRSCA